MTYYPKEYTLHNGQKIYVLYDEYNVSKITKECLEMLLNLYQQGRADIIDELYNKIDEGVCDICEHKDFESDCFKTCNFEVENAKKWLLSLKEQNK